MGVVVVVVNAELDDVGEEFGVGGGEGECVAF